ncbi:MAG: thioredoxin [Dehalococcoidia bacterium]|nr:thioredoxin [Dehalococcoidia bacterium]
MQLSPEEARAGTKKILTRQGKRLEVTIPAGTSDGSMVKLTNALKVTDGRPGDILITVRTASANGGVVEISDSTFGREVLESSLPVVVDFWAPWCGPCRMIGPIMEKLSGQYTGRVKFCKINVDENPQSASRYQAMSIPLLVFFRGGGEAGRSVGALPEVALRSKIDSILG